MNATCAAFGAADDEEDEDEDGEAVDMEGSPSLACLAVDELASVHLPPTHFDNALSFQSTRRAACWTRTRSAARTNSADLYLGI